MTESERRIADRLVAVFRSRHPELACKVDVVDRSERGTAPTGPAQVVRLEPGTNDELERRDRGPVDAVAGLAGRRADHHRTGADLSQLVLDGGEGTRIRLDGVRRAEAEALLTALAGPSRFAARDGD